MITAHNGRMMLAAAALIGTAALVSACYDAPAPMSTTTTEQTTTRAVQPPPTATTTVTRSVRQVP